MQTKEKSSSSERVLGNPELPIWDYKQQIIDLVNSNQAVVLTAETGAGKSTQVPQFLAEAGYSVVVTQPRVLAARSVSERVSEEAGIDNLVGYRTAKERDTHPDNEILFCTDGLQVVRELCGNGVDTEKNQVLVLDEVHEWNINMEVLIAWAKERMKSP
jgi:HrpA-like RNA helicase